MRLDNIKSPRLRLVAGVALLPVMAASFAVTGLVAIVFGGLVSMVFGALLNAAMWVDTIGSSWWLAFRDVAKRLLGR